ncbi:MAG: hypothetical protein HQL12_01870 [Candidatus Omnitrophica bacterium]|nr:hypothetical protein [Candidatus Omnitrophota bacterium]
MGIVVGVDFDNTLLNYDDVFFHRALDLGLINDSAVLHKRQLRERIRLLPDGELLWQQIQAYVYTKGIVQAHLINGVKEFFISCCREDVRTFIVSHKTMYAPVAPNQINLRERALDWMKANGFFDRMGMGLNITQVYFESTRKEKIERIKVLGCTHFIDDLQEVFLEDEFPSGVKKVLYSPDLEKPVRGDIVVADSWRKIHECVFN